MIIQRIDLTPNGDKIISHISCSPFSLPFSILFFIEKQNFTYGKLGLKTERGQWLFTLISYGWIS